VSWRDRLAVAVGREPEPQTGPRTPMDKMDSMDKIPGQANSVHLVHFVHNSLPLQFADDPKAEPAPKPPDLQAPGLMAMPVEARQGVDETGAPCCVMTVGVCELAVQHGPACAMCAGLKSGPARCDWPGCPIYRHLRPRSWTH
jgi:hypothetical protein